MNYLYRVKKGQRFRLLNRFGKPEGPRFTLGEVVEDGGRNLVRAESKDGQVVLRRGRTVQCLTEESNANQV